MSIKKLEPGFVLLCNIPKSGTVMFSQGYGSLELLTPLTEHSVFNVGSVGKQFTGWLTLKAEEEQLFSLGDRVCDYIAGFQSDEVQLRDLLHHSSGLRDVETLLALVGIREFDYYSKSDLIALARMQKYGLGHRSKFMYSNTNYLLLALVLEKVTCKSITELFNEWILKPIGIKDIFVKEKPNQVIPGAVNSYHRDECGQWLRADRLPSIVGSSGIWASISGLFNWQKHLVQVNSMLNRSGLYYPAYADINYGVGLFVHNVNSRDIWYEHGGHEFGYSAQSCFDSNGYRVTCMSNNAGIDADNLAKLCFAYLLNEKPESTQQAEQAIMRISQEILSDCLLSKDNEDVIQYTEIPTDLKSISGRYICEEVPGSVVLKWVNNQLFLERGGALDKLNYVSGAFYGPGYTIQFIETSKSENCSFWLNLERAPNLNFSRKIC